MNNLLTALVMCIPAVLFLPVAYLLLRLSMRPHPHHDAAKNENAQAKQRGRGCPEEPRAAALLMFGVLLVLICCWLYEVYAHCLRH